MTALSASHGRQLDAIVMRTAVTGCFFFLDARIQKLDSLGKQSFDRFSRPHVNH